jgi:hypothetical protein
LDNFENASKQVLVYLKELIDAGIVNKLYIGVNDEKKALRNSKLLEFLQKYEFVNKKGLRLEKSVNLFPLTLLIMFGLTIGVLWRALDNPWIAMYGLFVPLYFMRSLFVREVRS